MQYKLMNGCMMLMFMKCKCKCGSQTPMVLQPSPLIKILSQDLTSVPLLIEFLITVPQIILSFPRCIAFTTLITPHDLVKLDHLTSSHPLTSVNHSNRLFFKGQSDFNSISPNGTLSSGTRRHFFNWDT